MTTTHTTKCAELRAQYEREIQAFRAEYPNACTTCGGYEIVGSGQQDYQTGEIDIEPCEDCVSMDRCGLCATSFDPDADHRPCGHEEPTTGEPAWDLCDCDQEREDAVEATMVAGITEEDFAHAAGMVDEQFSDQDYDFTEDDMAFDAERERQAQHGYR